MNSVTLVAPGNTNTVSTDSMPFPADTHAAGRTRLAEFLDPANTDEPAAEENLAADGDSSTDHAGLMASGALWAIGGAVVTAWTYSAAQDGGVYLVAWGAILFGVIDFFRGLFGMMTES